MRIVVTGATGNVGTSVVRALAADERVEEIVGVARRAPHWPAPRTRWVQADVERDPLPFAGADVVIHLAWLIQPSRDAAELERVNVRGSRRVFQQAADAGAAIVYASSIGVYSPGPKDRPVDESWPREGVRTSFYARHKAQSERALDEVEAAFPELRAVRLRPGLIFKREAGSEIRRLFAGPFLPSRLVDPKLLPILPVPKRLVLQAVHTDDVAEAYRLAPLSPGAPGAHNIAPHPVLHPRRPPGPRPGGGGRRGGPPPGGGAGEAAARAHRPGRGGAPAAPAAGLAGHGPRRAGHGPSAGAGGAGLDAPPHLCLGAARA